MNTSEKILVTALVLICLVALTFGNWPLAAGAGFISVMLLLVAIEEQV
jgi:hypothetical protein